MWPFSDFQYGFRPSQSTADLLTVVSDRIIWAFIRSGATRTVALDISDISKALDRVWHAGLLHKLKSNLWVPQGPILGPTLFLLYINDLPDDVICNIAIYADETTFYSKWDLICGNNLNWFLYLNLIYEKLDTFFSRGCSVSPQIYHTPMYGILFSRLGYWYFTCCFS